MEKGVFPLIYEKLDLIRDKSGLELKGLEINVDFFNREIIGFNVCLDEECLDTIGEREFEKRFNSSLKYLFEEIKKVVQENIDLILRNLVNISIETRKVIRNKYVIVINLW